MESAISGVFQFSASSIINKHPNNGVSLPAAAQNFQKERRGFCFLRVECCGAKGGGALSEEEIIGMKKLMMNESCREVDDDDDDDDMVQLLECLEKEAIMGDDKGRAPTDYNRRAQIFDKSSKVFQALKNSQNTSTV